MKSSVNARPHACKIARAALWSERHSPTAVAGKSWGLDRSPASPDYQTSSQSQFRHLDRCWQNTILCKGQQRISHRSGASLAVLVTEGSEPRGSAVLRKPIPQAFSFFLSFSCFRLPFFAVFIYFRYSIGAICTAQVRSGQHLPFRLLFPGDGNLIATFVPGSNRPRRGLSTKASSTHLKTTATATHATHASCDQFKMMKVDKKHWYFEFRKTEGVVSTSAWSSWLRSSRVHSLEFWQDPRGCRLLPVQPQRPARSLLWGKGVCAAASPPSSFSPSSLPRMD